MRIISPNKFQQPWEYKYVRFADGTILFCDACDWTASHQGIIDNGGCKAKPLSAGKIQVRQGHWCYSDYGSVTAKLRWQESDDDALTSLLQGFGLTYNSDIRR